MDALDWQERHSPTEPYELVVSKATRRTKAVARRRKQDCRLWEGMTPEMESAAQAIVKAVYILSGHASFARSGFERVDKAHEGDFDGAWLASLLQAYHSWTGEAQDKGIIPGAVLGVLYHGEGLTATDRAWKRRKGWAKEQVHRGLELYLSAGWRARAAERLT
jgi:hypothetical protein